VNETRRIRSVRSAWTGNTSRSRLRKWSATSAAIVGVITEKLNEFRSCYSCEWGNRRKRRIRWSKFLSFWCFDYVTIFCFFVASAKAERCENLRVIMGTRFISSFLSSYRYWMCCEFVQELAQGCKTIEIALFIFLIFRILLFAVAVWLFPDYMWFKQTSSVELEKNKEKQHAYTVVTNTVRAIRCDK